MYLISIYFDDVTDLKIRDYMKQIAKRTRNDAMIEGNVPPHITVAAFHTPSEELARKIFEKIAERVCAGSVQWVSVGTFLPHVIYISPVLNEYLHQLSVINIEELGKQENVLVEKRYQPFAWYPHTTLAKKLTREQLLQAVEVLQNQFGPFVGKVTKIGLASTNPYCDLAVYELE